jgi:uncharacterized membrane protein (Fun14 family)
MSESRESPGPPIETDAANAEPTRSIWQTPSVWVAAALMVIGLGLWAVQSLTEGEAEAMTPSDAAGATAFMESRSSSEVEEPADSGGLTPMSPAVFRLGAGYLGGFFLGWSLRKFIKLTLLVAGGLVVMLAAFQGLGWFEVNWPAVEEHLQLSLSWLHGQAGSFKTFVTGYLPSAGAGTAGLVVGFRRK